MPTPDLSEADRFALREYWRVYEPCGSRISAHVRETIARQFPEWERALHALTAEQIELQDKLNKHNQRTAILDGDWGGYFAELRGAGLYYAESGLSYSAWIELFAVYRDAFRDELTELARRDLQRAVIASRGLHVLLDISTEEVGAAYLEAKQRLLARSEERYRTIFENSPSPMWMYDLETFRFIEVNEAALRHYGYSREEFLAMTILDIRPEEDIEAVREDAALGLETVKPRVWRHLKKDGSLINVEIAASDFMHDGRRVRLVSAVDVTPRVQAEQKLRRFEEQLRLSQKMDALGLLAGGVAHDFNNVLHVIETYSLLLESSLEPADQRHHDVIEIRRAAERGTSITRQLLTMSRHSVGAPRSIDVAEQVEGFLPMLRRLVGSRIALVAPLRRVPPIVADPTHIERIIMNLAVNARDAMPDGGKLTIETALVEFDAEETAARGLTTGAYIELAVTDTGIGIDAETQARIFDPFFTTKEPGKGTGLGLAIVHGIVTQAGGAVTVYSELGHGTTFRVYLPVARATIATPAATTVEATDALPALTVIVYDEQREVRTVVARVLHDAGCHVLEAATSDEARRICVSHEGTIDVAIIDVGPTDTLELARQLTELRPSLRVVRMSGFPPGALSSNGGGGADLLVKPFSPNSLRAAIAKVVSDPGIALTVPPDRQPTRVLVADDDEQVRRAIVRMLRKVGMSVVDVADGRAAMAELETQPFDVVLSDVQMPNGTGLDLMRAVRRVDLDVPIILMSGAPDVESATSAIEYGAFRFVTKPLDALLVKTVEHAARVHALARLRRGALSITGAYGGAGDRAGTEVRFSHALDTLWLAFQPIVDAKTGLRFGVEALMRTNEPSMPTPLAVLDAASKLDRLPHIGRKVRALTARLATANEGFALFVNLHPEDLLDAELIDTNAPLTSFASRVVLEVTERASLASSPELTVRIARLRELGFRIAIDDIGAGYSGLSSFAELVPEIVKLDMSLVRDIHQNALKQRTTGALCRLCHDVGTLVVAEGIETSEERDCVVELGCDLLQGYLIGRPAAELTV